MWTVVLPADREEIVAYTAVPEGEKVHSPAEPLGDDSLLLKYLNPHAIVVISQSSDAASRGSAREAERAVAAKDESGSQGGRQQGRAAGSALTVHLIDGVTGDVIHRATHKNAAAPTAVVRSENWVFYSYWNTKARRTELASMALYEGAVSKYSLNPWSAFAKDDRAGGRSAAVATASQAARQDDPLTFSSFEAEADPIVLSRSFIFPKAIRTLAVTQSKRGITNKNILIGMLAGQVLSLDRRFMDPRRPDDKPTPSQQKEGLMQCVPFFSFFLPCLSYSVCPRSPLAFVRRCDVTHSKIKSH